MKKKSLNETFGSYIRSLRIKNEIGQRELAKKIGLAASYLNDIEKNKRSAPKNDIIKKLSLILKVDLNLLNDLAGISKKTLPPDILDYIEKNPEIISLLRSAKNNNLKSAEFEKVIEERLINAYKRIRSSVKNGLAIVAVERGASGGSYFSIPPQVQLEISSRNKIIMDEHSGRILVDAELAKEEQEKIKKIIGT